MKRIALLIGALALCLSCTVDPVSPNGNLSMQLEEDGKGITTFQDTGDPDQPWDIMTGGSSNSLPESQIFNCQPRGGFVMVIR